jgi:hypothetical protein
VSDLPPPAGTPVAFALHSDPWAEQARRRADHRAERRTQRRRRLFSFGVPIAVLLLAGGVVAAVVLAGDGADEPGAALATTGAPNTSVAPTTDRPVPAADGASVDEVWLLDRGDGSYDWGAIVSSASDVARRDLAVTVTLFDPDGREVFIDDVVIAQLVPDGKSIVGGVVEVDSAAPTRIEVTATLGSAAPESVATTIAVADVRRVSSGQVDRDDRLLGSIEVIDGEPRAVSVAALWRDDSGSVIASIFDVIEIEIDDAAQPTEFSLRLPRAIVPAGEPDEIVANAALLN